jgi:hypothetical protein
MSRENKDVKRWLKGLERLESAKVLTSPIFNECREEIFTETGC